MISVLKSYEKRKRYQKKSFFIPKKCHPRKVMLTVFLSVTQVSGKCSPGMSQFTPNEAEMWNVMEGFLAYLILGGIVSKFMSNKPLVCPNSDASELIIKHYSHAFSDSYNFIIDTII